MSKPKLIISTTGTSIGTNVRRDMFSNSIDEEDKKSIKDEIRGAVESKDINAISAETKSLHKISIDSSTHIAFIQTDTIEGELCAQVLSEWSDALIQLPSIPISYDEGLMDKCAQRLKQIEDETSIKSDAFWQGIDFYEREKFLSLVEEENGEVTLSPVIMKVW